MNTEKVDMGCSCNKCKHPGNKYRKYKIKCNNRKLRRIYKRNLKNLDDSVVLLSIGYTD